MMMALVLALALLQQVPAIGAGHLPETMKNAGKPIAVHLLFDSHSAALLWLEGTEQGPRLESIEAFPYHFRAWRYPQPVGDGTWVVLLDGRMQPIGAYRSAVPPAGQRCGLEVPVVKGTWWVVLLERRDGRTHVLGQYQVGPDFARIASRFGTE